MPLEDIKHRTDDFDRRRRFQSSEGPEKKETARHFDTEPEKTIKYKGEIVMNDTENEVSNRY